MPVFHKVSRHGTVSGKALHQNSVAKILKQALVRAGYKPDGFAAHSLRAGFATQAARNGASAFDIMRQTGHKSIAIVSCYVRDAEVFKNSSVSKLGLDDTGRP